MGQYETIMGMFEYFIKFFLLLSPNRPNVLKSNMQTVLHVNFSLLSFLIQTQQWLKSTRHSIHHSKNTFTSKMFYFDFITEQNRI